MDQPAKPAPQPRGSQEVDQMSSPRRIGAPDAKNRGVLLDAAERLLLEEGHTAVSSRRVAARAGLKPQLVHYYFRTMDELLVEVFRRRAEEGLAFQARALAGEQPLWALWRYSTDPAAVAITMEFTGIAAQSEAVRAEMARYSELFRQAQVAALEEILPRYGLAPALSPMVVTVLISSLSRMLSLEDALGFHTGHAEAVALVESFLREAEGDPPPPNP
ncbi:helix-turn-helix domain-containing protein [Actinocorallia sp. A-T 12471]|uniref:TetR/AcrR family transcriptional regulator n=1 Tax=Actinocorallia sp. A-T 12471 TaxID=3089813 RepID=UPI0029CBF70A|nr:helix-turn-helix domain-containing protein [Actinocorallia sp. A-T 12471]MDX6744876.1 helix-turn-helix domain-containing protein [Actinocorallia sp. A-T 12471]